MRTGRVLVDQLTVKSLVRTHGCAGWPGSVLVTKTTGNHFWFQQDKGYNEVVVISAKFKIYF